MALIEYWRVRCIKQHAYSGKMREVGDEYDMKPKFAKLLAQKGEIEIINSPLSDLNIVVSKPKTVSRKRKK
jgi:hypothetical protein